jgi:beta-N-acetylhexosaminidase
MRDRKYPILIDEEGGRVSRLSNFLDNSLFNQKFFGDIYKIDKKIGINLYKYYIDSISSYLRNLGINITTSPQPFGYTHVTAGVSLGIVYCL